VHEPSLFENAEMLGDGRLRYPGSRRESPHRLFSLAT